MFQIKNDKKNFLKNISPIKNNNSIDTPSNYKKYHFIKSLKEFDDKEKVKNALREYEKSQETNYFTYSKNIALGKINKRSKYDKNNNLIPYSYVGHEEIFYTSKSNKQLLLLNSSTIKKKKMKKNQIKEFSDNFQLIDNKMLHSYYDNIRNRILKHKNKSTKNAIILKKIPFPIRESLIQQENVFKRALKNKKVNNKLKNYLKTKSHKDNDKDLLLNKLDDFQSKTQEKIIINKNITNDIKYRDNFWNITLRNPLVNGKYERLGYLNVGTILHPYYTLFNLNKNIEFIKNPKSEKKIRQTITDLNEATHMPKTKEQLYHLNSMKSLEVDGKNLLNFEIERESKLKGKIILYNRKNPEYLYMKEKGYNTNNANKTFENLKEIANNKIFGNNYNIKDFYKHLNLTSKYQSSLTH